MFRTLIGGLFFIVQVVAFWSARRGRRRIRQWVPVTISERLLGWVDFFFFLLWIWVLIGLFGFLAWAFWVLFWGVIGLVNVDPSVGTCDLSKETYGVCFGNWHIFFFPGFVWRRLEWGWKWGSELRRWGVGYLTCRLKFRNLVIQVIWWMWNCSGEIDVALVLLMSNLAWNLCCCD